MRHKTILSACAVIAAVAATPAQASITVLSNFVAPGDGFQNPSPPNQGFAVGSSGWYYNNVRNNGLVGIATNLPRNGNGSAFFSSPSGAAKADIEFLPNAVDVGGNYFSGGVIAPFAHLVTFGYDWYRAGTSTNPGVQHPALRVLLDRDGDLSTIGDRGGLVFERAYNGGIVPVDQWVTDTIGANTNLWSFGLGLPFADGGYDVSLSEWQADPRFANAVIIGFSAGVGSGWVGAFTGAVDMITWTLSPDGEIFSTSTYNFEVRGEQVTPVAEPASLALLAAGLLGLGFARRRRG